MRTLFITLIPTLLSALLFGCDQKITSLDRSIQEYNQGQWLLAEMWAKESIGSHKHVDEARYIMGLCDFKLNHFGKAHGWFEEASRSSNPEVRGKATAMLGIIASNKGDFITATSAFDLAVIDLHSKDKQEAKERATSPTIHSLDQLSSQFFTLQFGAYRQEGNATEAIANLDQSLNRSYLGNAWITKETDQFGRTMYLVQAGRFSSRIEASNRKNIGDLPQCVVTANP